MSPLYPYVGPEEIRARAMREGHLEGGQAIGSVAELADWLRRTQEEDSEGLIAVTYVVDEHGRLRVADRRSEHVRCAEGGPVLAAGEMFFRLSAEGAEVVEVSNHSTGYCPDPSCWPDVARALDALGIPHPGKFTRALYFRTCPKCGECNVIKDDYFVCGTCGAELPRA
jgi:hypothetical protein